jgi:hypothetical protein
MTNDLHKIGERVWRFLEQALDGRDPDRDVPAAQVILHDLVDTISGTGLTKERWDADLLRTVDVPVKALLSHPERWNEAIKLTAIYFSSEWRNEHPFADITISRGIGTPIQTPLHPIDIDLELPLLKQLLARADEESRIRFFSDISEHAVLNALKVVLPTFDLTFREMVTLIHRVGLLGDQNFGTGSFYEAVLRWSTTHPAIARQIADAWLIREPSASSLSADALLGFVRGAVVEAINLDWRDKVLEQLDTRFSEDDSRLAVFVANLAWPRSRHADVEARHGFLVSRIQRRPELLVETGIRAMFLDASEFPLETLETALTLWRLLPKSSSEDTRLVAATALIECGSRATVSAKKKNLPLEPFTQILPFAIVVPLESTTGQLSRLDFLLEDLVDAEELPVCRFLEQWLFAHRGSIAKGGASLEELFPLLVQKGPDRATAWLLAFMISPDRELRAVASILFGRHRTTTLPREFLQHLSRVATSALAHVLAGGESLPGEVWIPCLVDMGHMRVDLLEVIKTLLLEDAAQQYPGELRRALDRWSEPPWLEAAQTILDRLERTRREWQLRGEIPELSLRPARGPWLQREQQALSEAVRRAQGKAIFMRIATKVSIARGGASSWTGSPDHRVPFSVFQTSVELPMLEVIDPVAAMLRRLSRRREAEEFIAMIPKNADA